MKHLIWPLLVLLIVTRHFSTHPVYKNGDKVRISATIYSDPVKYSTSQYLKIVGLKTYLSLTPEIHYGDRVVLEGMVKDGKLESPKIISVGKSLSPLSNFRNKIIDFYLKSLPQPESGLLAGMVLGAKGPMDEDFYNKTKLTGVAHVVVASGTNVTFVVSFLTSILFIFLPRRKAIPFVLLGILLYLFISGFDAPLIRAAIMSSCLFLGQELGKLISPWRIFFLTVLTMLVINPLWVTDIGFLLSFASTGSIMLLGKRIEVKLHKLPAILREDLSVSLSAQIGVSPILFVAFGQFNILSPVINVLVLWTVPILMILGSVGGTIGLLIPFFGKLILWLAYPLLRWFTGVVELFGD